MEETESKSKGYRVGGYVFSGVLLFVVLGQGYLAVDRYLTNRWTAFKHKIAAEELTSRVTSQDFKIDYREEAKPKNLVTVPIQGKDLSKDQLTQALYNCVRESEELSGRVAEISDISTGNTPTSYALLK